MTSSEGEDADPMADRERAPRRPPPSYKQGRFRDPKIADLQVERNPKFSADDMKSLVRRAAPKKRPKHSDNP